MLHQTLAASNYAKHFVSTLYELPKSMRSTRSLSILTFFTLFLFLLIFGANREGPQTAKCHAQTE